MAQLIILLFIGFAFSFAMNYCPNMKPLGEKCHQTDCNDTMICTYFSAFASHCCDWNPSPCDETGLYGWPTIKGHVATFLWETDFNTSNWYPKIIVIEGRNHEIACPLPRPFLFSNMPNTTDVYPVGFSTNGSPAKRCIDHEDCGMMEYCARSVNPSTCNDSEADATFLNNCLDQSNNGTASTFCYPEPRFADNTNIKVVKGTVVDLIGCNTHRDCDDASSFCNIVMPMKMSTNGTIIEYKGTCIQIACHVTGNGTILGQLGTGQEPCGSGNATCDEMSVCIEVPVQTDSHMSICCQAETTVPTVVVLESLGSTVAPLVSAGTGKVNGSEPEFLGSSAVAAADLSAVRTFCKPRVTAILATVYSFVVLFHAIVGGYIGIFYTIAWKKTTKGTNVAKIVEDTGDAEVRTRRAEEAAAELDREILELQGEICRDPAAHG